MTQIYDVVPDDLAAAASVHAGEAEQARADAEAKRATAAECVATANAEADRLRREAAEQSRTLRSDADQLDRQATELEGRVRGLHLAAGYQSGALASARRVADLEAEHAGLTRRLAKLDADLGRWGEDRQQANGQLAIARAAADATAMDPLKVRISSIDDLMADAAAERERCASRVAEIGGDDGPGELAEARKAADRHDNTIQQTLNGLFPGRPEAPRAAARAEFRAIADADAERIADEARAARKPQQRQIVMT